MSDRPRGYLVIIGGAEDKKGRCVILDRFISLCAKEPVIGVVTSASKEADRASRDYEEVFLSLGAERVNKLLVRDRDEANSDTLTDELKSCDGVFFVGGDQLRITTILGGTEFERVLKRLYLEGAVIAGTSAGASVMSETMITSGEDDEAAKKCTLKMAPGLGLIDRAVIDQHFAQRGRLGRLVLAVAQNPSTLGIGIDEDTAVIVTPEQKMDVIGSKSVTLLDGRSITYTNISELNPGEVLSLHNMTLHVLSQGYGYDLIKNIPYRT